MFCGAGSFYNLEEGVCLKYKNTVLQIQHHPGLNKFFGLYRCEALKWQLNFFNFTVNLLCLVKDRKEKVEANHNVKFLLFQGILLLY